MCSPRSLQRQRVVPRLQNHGHTAHPLNRLSENHHPLAAGNVEGGVLRSGKHVEPNEHSTAARRPLRSSQRSIHSVQEHIAPRVRKKQVRLPDVAAARCLHIVAHAAAAAARQRLHKLLAHLFRRPAAYHVLPLPLERFQKQGADTQHRDAAAARPGSSGRSGLLQRRQTSCAHAVAAALMARHAAAAASVVTTHVAQGQAAARDERVAFGAVHAVVDGFGPHQPALAHPLSGEVDDGSCSRSWSRRRSRNKRGGSRYEARIAHVVVANRMVARSDMRRLAARRCCWTALDIPRRV